MYLVNKISYRIHHATLYIVNTHESGLYFKLLELLNKKIEGEKFDEFLANFFVILDRKDYIVF